METYTAKVIVGKQTYTISVAFTFLYSDPRRAHVIPLVESALAETDEEIRDHNLLFAYRMYLDANEYPPLAHHKYMYNHLPTGPLLAKKPEKTNGNE